MAASKGSQAALTSWASTDIIIANLAPETLTINETAEVFDTTTLGTAYRTATPGLRSATASFNARYPSSPLTGDAGSLTLVGGDSYYDATGTMVGVTGYTLNMNWESYESTSFDSSNQWKDFVPGRLSWGGTIDLRLDDTEPLINTIAAGGASVTALFTLTSGHTFQGDIWVNGQNQSANVSSLNTQTFNFEGTGVLTSVGASNFITAGAVPDGDDITAAELVATYASGRTVTGDAFPTSVSLSVPKAGLITANVTAQFTGAVTKA